MSIIGTPDYQQGVFSPQILLANNPTNPVTITLPANIESLIILAQFTSATSTPTVRGATTAQLYPVFQQINFLSGGNIMYVCSVSNAADTQVTITWGGAVPVSWQVIGDSGVRVVTDAAISAALVSSGGSSLLGMISYGQTSALPSGAFPMVVNHRGSQNVVPVAPSTLTADHPPDELQFAVAAAVVASTQIIAAPGVGKRIRLFRSVISSTAGGTAEVLLTDGAANWSVSVNNGMVAQTDYGPSGVPMGANVPLNATLLAGAGVFSGSATYTIENI